MNYQEIMLILIGACIAAYLGILLWWWIADRFFNDDDDDYFDGDHFQ